MRYRWGNRIEMLTISGWPLCGAGNGGSLIGTLTISVSPACATGDGAFEATELDTEPDDGEDAGEDDERRVLRVSAA